MFIRGYYPVFDKPEDPPAPADPPKDPADPPKDPPADPPKDPSLLNPGDPPKDPADPPKQENWRDALDEGLRASMEKFASPGDLAKSYAELQKKVGESVSVPGEDATEGQIAAFRKKLGIPEAANDYAEAVKIPEVEGLEIDADQAKATIGKFAEVAHAKNIPPAAFQDLVNTFYSQQAEQAKAHEEARIRDTKEAEQKLLKDWGPDADANLSFGKRTVKKFDNSEGELASWLDTTIVDGVPLGSHPRFVDFVAKVGRGLSEDSVRLDPTPEQAQDLRQQADAVRAKRDEALSRGDQTEARRLDEEERKILARMPRRR